MFVADAGITLWIIVILLVGLLGFFLVLATMVVRFLGWVFRALTGRLGAEERADALPGNPERRVICPHPGCGHTNGPTALYCARCGRPLRRAYDVNGYG